MTANPFHPLAVALAEATRLVNRLDDPAEREVYAERLRNVLRRSAAAKGFTPPAVELILLALESALLATDPEPAEPEHQQPRTTH